MSRRMLRHRLIVGGSPLTVGLTSNPRHIEAGRLGVSPNAQHTVDFWAEHDDDAIDLPRTFTVFGTGHELPDGARHWGTTARTDDGFVWHLYELDGGAE